LRVSGNGPLFRKLDDLLLRVADLDAAISFHRDRLGHRVLWRSDEAVGFALPDTDAELVVHLNIGTETDVIVENVDEACAFFLSAGGEAVQPPFDIAIGRCARVRDPFGNELTLLHQSKGKLATDADGRVVAFSRGRQAGSDADAVTRSEESSGRDANRELLQIICANRKSVLHIFRLAESNPRCQASGARRGEGECARETFGAEPETSAEFFCLNPP
jgi:catechol 2,3-dioxygenase-like lactoylglutathione lyase family enzyme